MSKLDVRPEVTEALAAGAPVVALESTVIAQGLPYPDNLAAAEAMARAVRAAGAIPATIAILAGRITVGLTPDEIARLAQAKDFVKASARDLGYLAAGGANGATTVAGTLAVARRAGIRVFATGGIGGVHRGGEASLDISADLAELARSPLAVVSAGAKAILDLPRTLEVLESQGVPVVGYGTSSFPSFYSQDSGLGLDARVDSPLEAARLLRVHWGLGLAGGVLFANPPPAAAALPGELVEGWTAQALADSDARGIAGKAVTPYLLARLAELSDGRTLAANRALLEQNAAVAGAISAALSAGEVSPATSQKKTPAGGGGEENL